MTNVVVTGAAGFVGRALVETLLRDGLAGQRVERVAAMDLGFPAPHSDPRVVQVAGSIDGKSTRLQAYAEPVDVVFHLASVPGGAAERDYELGRRINLDATLGLLEDLRGAQVPPRFVFASTIAVYGEKTTDRIDESTLPAPALTYGAHKLMCESLVADASRLGWVNGCSLRLPGVVARPGEGTGLISAYMSLLFWRLSAGLPITVPVSPHGKSWWISVGACVANLLNAARVPAGDLNARRAYQMPALWLSVSEVVDALAERYGASCKSLVTYAPDERVDRLFAAYPPLFTPATEALGFAHDGTVAQLVERSMAR